MKSEARPERETMIALRSAVECSGFDRPFGTEIVDHTLPPGTFVRRVELHQGAAPGGGDVYLFQAFLNGSWLSQMAYEPPARGEE